MKGFNRFLIGSWVPVIAITIVFAGCGTARRAAYKLERSLVRVAPSQSKHGYLKLIRVLKHPEGHGTHLLAFRPDGRHLASATRGAFSKAAKTVSIWDIEKGKIVYRMEKGEFTDDLVYTPDGKYFILNPFVTKYTGASQTAAEEFGFEVYGAQNYQLLKKVDKGSGILLAGPHGRYVYQGGFRQKGLRKYDLQEWREVKSIYEIDQPDAMALSPDGRILVDGSIDQGEPYIKEYSGKLKKSYSPINHTHNIRIWDTETMAVRRVIQKAHEFDVVALAFSPDGNHVASGGKTYYYWRYLNPFTDELITISKTKDVVKIWDVQTGELISSTKASRWEPKKIYYSKTGNYLFVLDKGSSGRKTTSENLDSEWSLKVWDIAGGKVIDQLKIKRTRFLYTVLLNKKQTVMAVGWEDQIWLYAINAQL